MQEFSSTAFASGCVGPPGGLAGDETQDCRHQLAISCFNQLWGDMYRLASSVENDGKPETVSIVAKAGAAAVPPAAAGTEVACV
eukprot:6186022-Pleurochrysis_carterae.AAC.2